MELAHQLLSYVRLFQKRVCQLILRFIQGVFCRDTTLWVREPAFTNVQVLSLKTFLMCPLITGRVPVKILLYLARYEWMMHQKAINPSNSEVKVVELKETRGVGQWMGLQTILV